MRKLFTIIFLSVVSCYTQAQSTYHVHCADLFISEYAEPGAGLAGSKAIEIYNPSANTINLSGYTLTVYYNLCSTVDSFKLPPVNLLSHHVYVIIGGISAGTVDPTLNAVKDTSWSQLIFNVNDAIALFSPNYYTLDILGVPCALASSVAGWVLPTTGAVTQDITLVRQPWVLNGERNWNIGQYQWDTFAVNNFSHFGWHTMYPCGYHPIVSFATLADSVIESVGNYQIPLTLQYPNGDTTFVTVHITGGTATASADYTTSATQVLIFPPYSQLATSYIANDSIHIIDDLIPEPTETVTYKIIAKTNASSVIDTVNGHHYLYILDNDFAPMFNFSSSPDSIYVNENVGGVLIPLSFASVANAAYGVQVSVNTALSTAQLSDYIFTTQIDSIHQGQQTVNVFVQIVNDCIPEGMESIVLHLSNPNNGSTIGADSTFTIFIKPNDSLPTIHFPVSQFVFESVGNDSMPVYLSHRYCDTIVVHYLIDTTFSTTTYGADYNAIHVSDSIIFYPGDSLKFITLHVIDDNIQEPTENIILQINSTANGITTALDSTQIFIQDNDGPPVYYFKTPVVLTVNQTNTIYQIPVIANGGIGATPYLVNISVDAINTTATLGSDFTFTNQTVIFPFPKDTIFIPLTLMHHCQFEPLTKVVLKLTNPVNGTIGSDSTYTINIKAHDTLPAAYVLKATDSILENAGNAFIKIGLNRAYCDTVKVIVNIANGTAIAGSDYNNVSYPDTLIFLPNSITPQTVLIPITDDTIYENFEAFNYSLIALGNCTAINPVKDSITIVDNDPSPFHPVVQFKNAAASWFESAGTVLIPISITNPNHFSTSVAATVFAGSAILGADFTTTSPKTFTFPPNSSTTLYDTVHIINHMIAAPSKTFLILLSNPTNGATLGLNNIFTGTIIYNDTVFIPTIQFVNTGKTISESANTISLPITINHPNANPIYFSYTLAGSATLNSDYSMVTTIPVSVVGMINNSNIQINIVDDNLVEPTENIVITLSAGTNCALGNNLSTTVYILDNDTTASASGINNVFNSFLKLYPNPIEANGILKIVGGLDNTAFELYNVLGEKIFTDKISNQQINLAKVNSLYSGMYFYKLISSQGIAKEGKLIVK